MFDFHFHLSGPCAADLAGAFGPQTPVPPMLQKTATIGDGPFQLALKPLHNGRPVAVDGPAEITLSDPELLTVRKADDSGLVFEFADTGAVGTTQGVATIDARIGPDRVEKVLAFEITVQVPEADQLLGAFGDQVPLPGPVTDPANPGGDGESPAFNEPAALGG
jgi:hypothetical protein